MLLRILERLLSDREFLSPYGVRSVSRILHDQRNPAIGGLHAHNTLSAFSKVNPVRKC